MDVNTIKSKYIAISVVAALACVVSLFVYKNTKEKTFNRHILTITVVRHAESYQNIEKQANMPENLDTLTTTGKKQAEELATIFSNHTFDLWVSSPTGRTMETRDITLSQNKAKGQIRENEAFFSTRKGLDESGNTITWGWREKNWQQGKDLRPTNGESLKDTQDRAVTQINDWAKSGKYKNIIVFTHSDVYAALVGYIQKTPIPKTYQEHAPPLAGYTFIQIYENNIWKIIE